MHMLKKFFCWLLNLFWFIFIIVIIGQIAALIEIGKAYFGPPGAMTNAITKQAIAGNFIVFSSCLVAASMYFLIREYNSSRKAIELQSLKSLLILFGIALFVISAIYLNSMPQSYQKSPIMHWFLYGACMLEVFFLWCIDEANSAKSFKEELASDAEKLQSGAAKAKDDGKGTKL